MVILKGGGHFHHLGTSLDLGFNYSESSERGAYHASAHETFNDALTGQKKT